MLVIISIYKSKQQSNPEEIWAVLAVLDCSCFCVHIQRKISTLTMFSNICFFKFNILKVAFMEDKLEPARQILRS